MLQCRGKSGSGSFGRYSLAPERSPEGPGNLDLVSQSRHVIWMQGAGPAGDVPRSAVVDQPKTEAVLLPVLKMVAKARGSMVGVERHAWTKGVPDIRIGPDREESI